MILQMCLERDGSGSPNYEGPGLDLPSGMKTLHSLANVPKSWPLARLTIRLSAASKHLERKGSEEETRTHRLQF